MVHVLIDGDNVPIDSFLNNVQQDLNARFGSDYTPTVVCQSNVIMKYTALRCTQLKVRCTKTRNKNASDARIIFEVGKLLITDTNSVIVVISNDRIFEEIVDNVRVFQIGFVYPLKRKKLTRENVINTMKEMCNAKDTLSEDVYLEDLAARFKVHSISSFQEYLLQSVKEIQIASNDSVFFTNDPFRVT